MNEQIQISPWEQQAINQALHRGQTDRAFFLLADYLARNRISLSDAVLRHYIEQELFTCLKGRGHNFDTM